MKIAWLPLAATLALAGCIENPEPDPRIGGPRPESKEVPFHFQGFLNRLTLVVTRDSGRLRLEARNMGPGRIDSLRFLLKMNHSVDRLYPGLLVRQTKILREYFLAAGPIDSYDALDLGEIDTLRGISLNDIDFSAHVFGLSYEGTKRGQHSGFAFRGLFQRIDSLGDTTNGYVNGTLQADGKFSAGMSREKNGSIEADWSGMLDADGWLQGRLDGHWMGNKSYYAQGFYDWALGSLRENGNGIAGTFHLFRRRGWPAQDSLPDPGLSPKDSLEILVETYSSD
jgi:hypothetical protein